MSVYNCIGGTLGAPHFHRCGIPQGCPFSMVFISLYLRSWISQMLSIHACPRTLADDILVTAKGSRALHIFHLAFDLTIRHLLDLGGKLAPGKSKIFASFASHRRWLASYVWDRVNQTIPVVTHLRDLGSSIFVGFSLDTSMSQS
eukprot:10926234-Karenia_brevis.AAC.1